MDKQKQTAVMAQSLLWEEVERLNKLEETYRDLAEHDPIEVRLLVGRFSLDCVRQRIDLLGCLAVMKDREGIA